MPLVVIQAFIEEFSCYALRPLADIVAVGCSQLVVAVPVLCGQSTQLVIFHVGNRNR